MSKFHLFSWIRVLFLRLLRAKPSGSLHPPQPSFRSSDLAVHKFEKLSIRPLKMIVDDYYIAKPGCVCKPELELESG